MSIHITQSHQTEPSILYKCCSLAKDKFEFTRDIFLKNELYFPHPDQINDPFDCKIQPSFENVTSENIIDYLNGIESKNYEIESYKIELAKNNAKLNNPKTITQALKAKCGEGHLQNVGVLSLTSKKLDILMWSHYSDAHKGICIGFDYAKLFFIFNGTPLYADDVKYPEFNQYPSWNPFEDPAIDKLYLTKALDWKYEQEWRIIFPEKGRTAQKFDPNALVSVHLGCQISKEHKETVINWCSQRKQKPKIYQTTTDGSSYSLKENEITY